MSQIHIQYNTWAKVNTTITKELVFSIIKETQVTSAGVFEMSADQVITKSESYMALR